MEDTNAPGGSPDFQRRLLEIRQDPQVIRLALRWARHRELAEDALQTAYYRVASVPDPERIINLRAYFLRTLKNEITGLYSTRPPVLPVDDPETLSPPQPGPPLFGPASEPPVDDQACYALQLQIWLQRLAAQRDSLIAGIPARSDDPGRYRALIYGLAEPVLLGHLSLEPNDPDFPKALRAAHPGYFHQPGAAPNTLHQRISRAREDLKALLRAIVDPGELF